MVPSRVETGCSAIKNLFGSILVRARLNAGTPGSMTARLLSKKNPGLSVCGNGLAVQGIDFLKNGLKSLFQLLLGPWFSFCSGKLPVISNGAPVKIGRFSQQFSLGIILGGHTPIL
jgi:hypothetical protein